MKKIINKKKYDTETAQVVHRSVQTYKHAMEDKTGEKEDVLYKKSNGEFFCTNKYGLSGSQYLYALDEQGLQEWLEEYMTVEEYEAMFGEVSE